MSDGKRCSEIGLKTDHDLRRFNLQAIALYCSSRSSEDAQFRFEAMHYQPKAAVVAHIFKTGGSKDDIIVTSSPVEW